MAFSPGQNVGPYRIVEQLGQGGMASVFKAYHAALDRYVALKVLHPAFMEDPNFLARFQREARVVAKLDHPNIVPIYDFAEHQGQPYLVMKYIEGRTLKAILAETEISTNERLKIIRAVGQALSYAHQRGVLHRDIKPSNVLLSDDGGIYLADFGLARIAQAGQSTLSNDMLLGTPQYISPEQARGEQDLDDGTDIYSLGVVIYEMMVGRVPFNADTPFSIIHDHIYSPLPMPRTINPAVPERVERVLLKALAKERADRFDAVLDLVEALEGAVLEKKDTVPLQSLPAATTRELEQATGGIAEPEIRDRRWLWIAGGILIACLCLFAFWAIFRSLEQRDRVEAATATAMAVQDAPVRTPLPGEESDDPRILELREAIAAEPENPELHIQLAETLAQAGFARLASRSWLQAAEIYMEQGAYLDASRAFNEVMILAGGPQQLEAPVREQAMEALFMSATSPREFMPLLDQIQQEYPDWQLALPIRARLALYNGNLAQAIVELERAHRENSDPMLTAVLAEAYLLDGRLDEANGLAHRVLEDPRTPDWLRVHTEDLIRQIESN